MSKHPAPLVRTMLLIQAATAALGVGLVLIYMAYLNHNTNQAFLAHNKLQLLPLLEAKLDKWCVWHRLGLQRAIVAEKQEILTLTGVRRLYFWDQGPPATLNADTTVVAHLPKRYGQCAIGAEIQQNSFFDSLFSSQHGLPLVSMLALFAGFALWGVYYFKRRIYNPLLLLSQRLSHFPKTGSLELDDIDQRGEIGAFAKILKDLHRQVRETEIYSTVAETTQMLAHDVRKPFSMLEGILQSIANLEGSPEAIRTFSRYEGDIRQAMQSVNNMLQDIAESGSMSGFATEPTTLGEILEIALNENFGYTFPPPDYRFAYAVGINHKLQVNCRKMVRVFSNLIGNAIQAAPAGAQITFKAEESKGKAWVMIHNTGSYIDEAKLNKIFNSFYSDGKRQGTGLGLTIAKRIVEAHGGVIECRSDESGTSFWMELPLSTEVDDFNKKLPRSPAGALRPRLIERKTPMHDQGVSGKSELLLKDVALSLMVVDDEQIYCESILSHIKNNDALSKDVGLEYFCDPSAAVEAAAKKHYDVVFMDVDFGPYASQNGIDAVRRMRERGVRSVIWFCTNRIFANDDDWYRQAGAQGYLPKPMSSEQMLRIIASAVQNPS